MNFSSENLWEKGEDDPSNKEKIVEFLKQNPDTFYNSSDIGEMALDEARSPMPGDKLTPDEARMQSIFSLVGSAKTEVLLEQLVYEGIVEKRQVPVADVMDQIDEQHDVRENLPPDLREEADDMDFGGVKTEYYRISQN